MQPTEGAPWLLLIHQLPPQPAYLRVKIWRRLQAMGAVAQLPRLGRLERMGPDTRVSFAGMLDEAARVRGGDVAFLYQDRAHTHAAAKGRVDNVVRGLLSVGIRRGEHVGVLMSMRRLDVERIDLWQLHRVDPKTSH